MTAAPGGSDGVPGFLDGSAQFVPFVLRRLHMSPGNRFQRSGLYRLAQIRIVVEKNIAVQIILLNWPVTAKSGEQRAGKEMKLRLWCPEPESNRYEGISLDGF